MSEQTIAEQMRDYVKHEKRMTLYTADKLLRWADELAALSASGAGVGWQPIATAPKKDGVLVLLHPSRCWSEDVNADCEVGYWDEIAQDWVAVGAPADDYTGPTHWMPLPVNPVAGVSVPPPPEASTAEKPL